MPRTTRRQVIVTAATASALAGQQPSTLSAPRFEALSAALDQIIPSTDTPGAAGAGVPKLIDGDAPNRDWRVPLEDGLDRLIADSFLDANDFGKKAMLTLYMEANDERADHFRLLKGLAVDYYYATEEGLVDELGYVGGTYLADFPGCTHPEHLEGE